jgi:DNA-binding NarL/FixJ family response regulator
VQSTPTIRVIVADDHHLVRQGIRALLEQASGIEVVGEAADGREAVDLVEHLTPDVLVMDLAMPRLDGSQAITQIRALGASTRVIILSMYTDATLVRRALRDGASGYLPKCAGREELLLAVRAAHRGQVYLSPTISRPFVEDFVTSQIETDVDSEVDRLTSREREVLQLVVEGHSNRSAAQVLQISVKTVEKHRSNLMSKLGAHNLAELIRTTIRNKLVFL